MSEVKWIKLSTAIFDDEKIRYIETLPDADSILTIWVKLLVLAGRKNMGGEIYFNDELPYTEEMLSTIFNRKINTVRLALGTFEKLRMITIAQDRTIIICNWPKYQNLEGLDKIRQQTLDRVRRHRLRSGNGNVSCNVTDRYSVTHALRDVTPQSKNKNREEPPIVPQRGTGEQADCVSFDEAREWFNNLFGRNRAWSDEEEALLTRLLPVSREDQKLIGRGYSLPRDSEGWALMDGERLTKPKQSLMALLREFSAELDKFNRLRRDNEAVPAEAPRDDWPAGAREVACELFGKTMDDLPRRFSDLGSSVGKEIVRHLRERGENAA